MNRIVMTGGGSGGHITPLLAVAHEVRQLQPDCEIIYIGQKGDSLGDIPAQDPAVDHAYNVRAGKFRRYHGEGLQQIFHLPTLYKNVRDVVYVLIGIVQSYRLLRRLKPSVVFIKGGFVGVPVGLAAAWLHIPFVTHDSDALPGLANRIIARWASVHAVALPKEVYAYPPAKTVTVGVPISRHFHPVTLEEKQLFKQELGLQAYDKVLLVTGGGLGAQRLNDAIVASVPDLLNDMSELAVVHLSGRALEDVLRKSYNNKLTPELLQRVRVIGFTTDLYKYSAIADVIVTRAGGNSMAEFAAQGKACVVVPNPILAGGHQLKNANVLADRQAVELVDERALADPRALTEPIHWLLADPARAQKLGHSLRALAQPDAARSLAVVLLEQIKTT